MLEKIRLYFSYHQQAAIQSITTLFAKPFSALLTVIVIAIALTLPTLYWVLTANFRQLAVNWQQNGHVSLYLKHNIDQTRAQVLTHEIKNMPGVAMATLITAAQGLDALQQQEGMHDIIRHLPENPLPAMIEVSPTHAMSAPIPLKQLVNRLQQLPEVEQTKLDAQWLTRLHALVNFISHVARVIVAILMIAVVFIVANTQRLAIHHRQEEIRILKLMGATDHFIARHFLYTGVWYGMMGAIFALLFVNAFIFYLTYSAQELATAYQMSYHFMGLSVLQSYLVLLLAVSLGWLGAKLSLMCQLTSIEPYN